MVDTKPQFTVDLVRQEDRCGCCIASAAMLAGVSYQEAKTHFAQQSPDCGESGVSPFDVLEYLKSFGWERCSYRTFGYNREAETVSPVSLDPMESADVILCLVLPSMLQSHCMVVIPNAERSLSEATVIDPAGVYPDRLSGCPKIESLWGFRRINNGVVPVPEPPNSKSTIDFG